MTAGMLQGPIEVGADCWASLIPPGGWGESNTGLVRGGGVSLLVDTHFDLLHTAQMLEGLAPLTLRYPIRTVVNTHSDGDHWFGNQLVAGEGVEIIASEAAATAMTPDAVSELAALWTIPGRVGDFARAVAGRFDLSGVVATPPTRTFSGVLDLDVGGRLVRLVQVGPAHTSGDVIVHVPDAGVVFSGDIVFAGAAPLVWEGPLSRSIAACDAILGLDPAAVVPGHGPVTDAAGVRRARDYLVYVEREAKDRFSRGLSDEEAIASIDVSGFADMGEHERIVANVLSVYREMDPSRPRETRLQLFDGMAAIHGARRGGVE